MVCAEEARRLDYVATGMPSNQLLLRCQSVQAAEILVKHQRVCNTDMINFINEYKDVNVLCSFCDSDAVFYDGCGEDGVEYSAVEWLVFHTQTEHFNDVLSGVLYDQVTEIARIKRALPALVF